MMARSAKRDVAPQDPQTSGVLRPTPRVLAPDALVPAANLVEPPPDHFSHELDRDEPYRFGTDASASPDGEFQRGTPVLVIADDGHHAHVIDERGLYVQVRSASLRERR
jgi:hypothetical protein